MSLPIVQIKRRNKNTDEEYSTNQQLNGLVEGELGYNYHDNGLWIGPNGSTDGRDYSILVNEDHMLSDGANDQTWINGTTEGPKLSLREVDKRNYDYHTVTTTSIPTASTTQSGIMTTGNQSFAGEKTFRNIKIANSDGTFSATIEGPAANGTFKLPDTGGTFVTHATKGTKVGSSTKPVYIAATGRATTCSTYAGGTKVTLNGTSKGATTAEFYAPAVAGSANQVLLSAGSNASPTWTNQRNLDVGYLEGYTRSNLYADAQSWIAAVNLTYTIQVAGDENTYYPVRIPLSSSKAIPTIISIHKNLGTKTPVYDGNHTNGTSSMWLVYEGRNRSWDGNGGYIKTLYKHMGYANLCAHARVNTQSCGDLIVWLRGGSGGCEYQITTTNKASAPTIYYEKTNVGTTEYPDYVEPITAIDTTVHNQGIVSSTPHYGDLAGNASTASKLANKRTIFGRDFDGTGNISGQATVYGSYNSNASTRHSTSGLYIRENGLVQNKQSDLAYAPSLGFIWSGHCGGTINLGSDNKFYFRKGDGASKAILNAELDGNASTASALNISSAVGSGTKPVYFKADGTPAETTYSLEKSVPNNALFTDENAKHSTTNVEAWRPVILHNYYDTTYGNDPGAKTGQLYYNAAVAVHPKSGTIRATKFTGSFDGTSTNTIELKKTTLGSSGSSYSNYYRQFATAKVSTAWESFGGVFVISDQEAATVCGIVRIKARTSSTYDVGTPIIEWVVLNKSEMLDGIVAVKNATGDFSYYIKAIGTYNTYQISCLHKDGSLTMSAGSSWVTKDSIKDKIVATSSIKGIVNTAEKLRTSRTIQLSGDVTGSVAFDGSQDVTITTTVQDDSHNHVIGNIDNLQSTLDAKLPLAGGTMTGLINYKTTNYTSTPVAAYDDGTTYGHTLVIGAGGTTYVGAGESAQTLYTSKLKTVSTEDLILGADSLIRFYPSADTATASSGVTLNGSNIFYPQTNKNGAIGSSSYRWSSGYFGTVDGEILQADATSKTPFKTKNVLNFVNTALTWNSSSYLQHVILLLPVPTTTNWSGHNRISGTFICWKTGGNVYDEVKVSANCVYNNLTYHIESYGQHAGANWKLVRCKYNNIEYYALSCPYHANPYTHVEFIGHVRSDLAGGTDHATSKQILPFDVAYYNEDKKTAVNTEVNGSLSTTLTTTVMTSANSYKLAVPAGFQGVADEATSVTAAAADATYTSDRPIWFSHKDYTNRMAYATTMTYNYNTDMLKVGQVNASKGIGINATTGTGVGISLYGGSAGTTAPTYGLMFAKTASFSTFGGVTSDWATYFTMSDATDRGWIFRRGGINVFSIDGTGSLYSHIANTSTGVYHKVSNSNGCVGLYASTNRGLYDFTNSKWIIYTYKADNTTHVPSALYLEEGHLNSSTTLYLTSAASTSILFMQGGGDRGRFNTSGQLQLEKKLLLKDNIQYNNGGNPYDMISFITGDANGAGIVIGGGGLAVFGSGESAATMRTGLSLGGATETTYLTSDNSIEFYSGCQDGAAAAKHALTLSATGYGIFYEGAKFNKTLTVGSTTDDGVSPGCGIKIHDLRDISATPGLFGDHQMNFYFDQITDQFGGTDTTRWMSIMHLKGWNGNYAAWELAGNACTTSENDTLRYRQGVGTTWGDWQSILTDHNFDIYCDDRYVNVTGDTMSGTLSYDYESSGKRILSGTTRNSGMKYDYAGNECLIISSGTYADSSIQFFTANGLNMNDSNGQWNATGVVPSFHIRKTGVAVNYNLTSDPTYNLYVNGTGYFSSNVNIDGTLTITRTQDVEYNNATAPALIVGGTASTAHVAIDSNEIMAKATGTTASTLYLNNGGGLVSIGSGGLQSGGSIVASTNNTYHLGSSSVNWQNLYIRNIYSGDALTLNSASGSAIIFRPQGIEQGGFNTSGQLEIKATGAAKATIIGPGTAGTFYFPNTGGTFVTHATRGTAVGSGTKPVYIASTGRATASTSTVGGTAKPVYMNAGTITECSSTVGGATTQPVYLNAGTITGMTTVGISYGGTGNTTGTAKYVATGDIGTSSDTHATALKTYFTNNKSTVQRNRTASFYSNAYGNGSLYMGYYLSGYDSNPYGGFFVAHYNTPYYVGIQNGTFSQWELSKVGHTHSYLPLSGGTLTGILNLMASQYTDSTSSGYALNLQNSNIVGVNSIYTADLSDSSSEGIHFYRDGTYVDSLWAKNGTLYFTQKRAIGGTGTDQTVLHTGNYSSYALPRSGGTMTGPIKLGSHGILGYGATIPSGYYELGSVDAANDYSVWIGTKGDGGVESSGIKFDGDKITFWCPGDSPGVRFLDSDSTTSIGYVGITALSYNATSDARLKCNLRPFEHGDILSLPLYKFDYISGAKDKIGCLAQDLQAICPEIVHVDYDGYLSIEESKIVYLLLDKMKKMQEEIMALKEDVAYVR